MVYLINFFPDMSRNKAAKINSPKLFPLKYPTICYEISEAVKNKLDGFSIIHNYAFLGLFTGCCSNEIVGSFLKVTHINAKKSWSCIHLFLFENFQHFLKNN